MTPPLPLTPEQFRTLQESGTVETWDEMKPGQGTWSAMVSGWTPHPIGTRAQAGDFTVISTAVRTERREGGVGVRDHMEESMTDLARCQREAQSALATWLEAWDIGAFQGWVDWTIEQDYIALEVRNVAVCKLPQNDLAGGIVSGVQAQGSAGASEGAGELSAVATDHA